MLPKQLQPLALTTCLLQLSFLAIAQTTASYAHETLQIKNNQYTNAVTVLRKTATNIEALAVVYVPLQTDTLSALHTAMLQQQFPNALIVLVPGMRYNANSTLTEDATYNLHHDLITKDISTAIKEKYNCANTCYIGCVDSTAFSLHLLRQGCKCFNYFFALEPHLTFNNTEQKAAQKFFKNMAYYKGLDIASLGDMESAWPDEVLLKLGARRPIYFEE